MNTTSEPLYTTGAAAAALGVAVITIRKRLAAGIMAGQNYGGRLWLIPAAEVHRLADAGGGRLRPGRRPKPRPAGEKRSRGAA